jgi:uncharacterized protein (UPF0332 family)
MPFDWKQYLTLAKTLSQAVTDEASLRSAVSRSYYSAFKLASERAELNGYREKFDETGSSHQLLWDLYGRNANSNDCRRLAFLGPRMKRRRVKADYKSVYPQLTDEVRFAIQDADECVALLGRLPKGVPVDIPRSWRC